MWLVHFSHVRATIQSRTAHLVQVFPRLLRHCRVHFQARVRQFQAGTRKSIKAAWFVLREYNRFFVSRTANFGSNCRKPAKNFNTSFCWLLYRTRRCPGEVVRMSPNGSNRHKGQIKPTCLCRHQPKRRGSNLPLGAQNFTRRGLHQITLTCTSTYYFLTLSGQTICFFWPPL